jgi:integrase
MEHAIYDPGQEDRPAWNVGRKLGAKRPLLPKQVWAVRFFLEQEHRLRDRALFDLAIDSKLRCCDLVKIKIDELVSGARIREREIIVQQKTGRPVQFELLEPARTSLLQWLERRRGSLDEYVFPSRANRLTHMSTRQYARLVDEWVTAIGLRRLVADPAATDDRANVSLRVLGEGDVHLQSPVTRRLFDDPA